VPDIEQVALDDEVVAISANPTDPNSVENIAKLGTIPYEIVVHIPSELPRVVV
jgi:alanine racemase